MLLGKTITLTCTVPLSTPGVYLGKSKCNAGDNLRWTSIPFMGKGAGGGRNTPSCVTLPESGIRPVLVGCLACMETLP